MKKGFWLFILMGVACASRGYRIVDQNLSLADIKKSVQSVIGEPRALSENQRVYFSQYFGRKQDAAFDPQKAKERLYSKVSILGDRRPYDVEVEVIVEEKDNRGYFQSGTDLSEAKRVGKEIRQKLNQSREDRNVIDDFRAF